MSIPGSQRALSDSYANEEDYELLGLLGEGAHGTVQLAKLRRTGEQVAIKFLPRGASIDKHVQRELKAHVSFSHPHVVGLRHLFLTDTHLAMVFEVAEGGDLYNYVASKQRGLTETEARRLFQQLIIAIEYCHHMGVVNRDIKLENVLLDKNRRLLKLTDFGYAKSSQDSCPKSKVGTPNYAAPEVISNAQRRYCGQKADTWSCGVLLYVLLFHRYPFERSGDPTGAEGLAKIVQRTLQCDWEFPASCVVSRECRDLLRNLIKKDPNQRFGTAEIMRHPWFLVGLPQGWDQLNSWCLRNKDCPRWLDDQAEKGAWIDRMLAVAREPASPLSGSPMRPSLGQAGPLDAAYALAEYEERGAPQTLPPMPVAAAAAAAAADMARHQLQLSQVISRMQTQ